MWFPPGESGAASRFVYVLQSPKWNYSHTRPAPPDTGAVVSGTRVVAVTSKATSEAPFQNIAL